MPINFLFDKNCNCFNFFSNRDFFFSFLFTDFTHSLHISEIRVPKHVVTGADAQLECRYDLGGDALYSVKWYKDGNEFYRYVPRDMPPAQVFKLPGVHVVVSFTFLLPALPVWGRVIENNWKFSLID